jgi:hypothetical protein
MSAFDFLSVNATGVQVTSGAASAVVALPANAATRAPKHVRIQANGYAYIRPGTAGTTATVNDIMVSGSQDLIIYVGGFTHIAYLQETAAAKINITPLED